jgi:hypothetical protein
MEQQEAFVEQLKKLFSKTGIVANRPRGRPRKTGVSKEQVKPSKVPKKERLRAKKRLDVILNVRPLLKRLVEEYQRLIRSKMDASRYAKDLLTFRERPPTKKELQLMPEYALPSKLGTKNIRTAEMDIREYKKEMKEYCNHMTIGYELENYTAPPGEDPDKVNLTIGQYLRRIKELLEVKLVQDMDQGKIKPGFYMLLKIQSTFRNKDEEPIEIWTSSLTHRRNEVYDLRLNP